MKKDFINIGIIGVGNIGSAHAASIYGGKIEGMKLASLCDTSAKRRAAIQTLYPDIPMFEDADALLASGLADAVIIATPHYFHPIIAKKAFAAGLHVLTEKPVGVTCKDAKDMMEAAKQSGKLFAIMFNQRTNKLFRAAKEIVSSGALGELKRCVWLITNWYRKQCYYDSGGWRATWNGEGGGVLLNQAPHNLDILQWLCGMPSSVYARCDEGKYHHIEVEDDATIMMRYPNGMTAVFITSTGEFPGTNRLEISGTKGKLVIENGKLTHTSLAIDERDFRLMEESAVNEISITEISDEKYNGHINILCNFARAILNGEPLVAPGYDGIFELTISNAAYLSSWIGEEISLPMDDEAFATALEIKKKRSETKAKSVRESIQFAYKDRWNTNW
ncbi:MAG: Gfo/Idh/MocA family oxidoreductase [Clostridia bacterium]|nr:Gfo/Idh/MocA family oxidoreductase [Clostridia bacterium]